MSRSGRPPQPVIGGMCVCRDSKPAMDDGIFCSDHELLWIAHAGTPSHKLKRKYKKLYAQFMKMYRVKGVNIYREIFNMVDAIQQQQSSLSQPHFGGK